MAFLAIIVLHREYFMLKCQGSRAQLKQMQTTIMVTQKYKI